MPNSEHCLPAPGYLCTGLYAVNTSGVMPLKSCRLYRSRCRVWRKPTTTGQRRYCARWDTSSANCRKQQIGGPKPGDCRGLGGRPRPLASAGLGGDACRGARPRRCGRA
jgi:hypothetical protein